jgi:hypothetical protein
VQKAGLRRDCHRQFCGRDQDRLTQLPVPCAIAELAPLEGGELEIGRFQMRDHIRGLRRLRSRRRLADRADRDPDIIVELPHRPVGKPAKAVLELGRTPLLECRMPARGHQPVRSRHRPRIPAAVREILAELACFVGDHQHVMGWHVLREGRNLLLNLLMPAVRAPASSLDLERALLDDFRSEPLCSAPKRSGECFIAGSGPVHQEPAPPLLPDQVLRQRIGEHGP